MDFCRLTRGPDIVPEGLVSAHPHCDSPVYCFVAPQPSGRVAAGVVVVGGVTVPTYVELKLELDTLELSRLLTRQPCLQVSATAPEHAPFTVIPWVG